MNYFLTPSGLQETNFTAEQMFDYICETELKIGRPEALELFQDLFDSQRVLFKPRDYDSVQLQQDYSNGVNSVGASAYRRVMVNIERQIDKKKYVIISNIRNGHEGDAVSFISVGQEVLISVFRKHLLEELLPLL